MTGDKHLNRVLASAFWTLAVSARDDRKRILDAAEERSLSLDPATCARCRDALANPRTRLAEEMRWLPGISPRRAQDIAATLASTGSIGDTDQLPPLVRFNIREASFAAVTAGMDAFGLADEIEALAMLGQEIDAESVLRDVNEDRSIAQFPVARTEQVEDELKARRKESAGTILETLGTFPTETIVSVMTLLAERFGLDLDDPFPEVLELLIELYEVEAQQFLQPEAENLQKLCDGVLRCAEAGEQAIRPLLERLAILVRRWDSVAQPLQLLAYSRGLDHPTSAALGRALRKLSLELHNEHGLNGSAEFVAELCQEAFAELPDLSSRFDEDVDALRDIAAQAEEGARDAAALAREITYSAEVGSFIKHTIAITPEALAWKEAVISLADVTAMRWGGTRGRYGESFSLVLSGEGRSMEVAFSGHQSVFSAITNRLWRAVGARILVQTLNTLRSGKPVQFGGVTIDDTSVYLFENKFFGTPKMLRYPLHSVQHYSRDGELILVSADGKGRSSLSYLQTNNAHVLNVLLNIRKDKGAARLSAMLS